MTARQGLPFEEIKARISCDEYARNVLRLNLHADGDGWRGRSFRSDSENPTTLHISNGLWTDFATGKGGDVIDLCAEVKHNGDKAAAARELIELCGIKMTDGGEAAKRYSAGIADLRKLIEHWHGLLTDSDRDYLHKRGIKDETIDALLIGRGDNNTIRYGYHDGRLICPYWRHGQIVYFISREMAGCTDADKKYKKAILKEHAELDHCVWGLDTIPRNNTTPLIIAEGMFDALSFWQEGYRVISPITGRFSKEQTPDAISAARHCGRVVMVFDNDTRGSDFRVGMAELLFSAGVSFSTCRIPKTYNGESIKDVSDFYQRGGSLAELINEPVPAAPQMIARGGDARRRRMPDYSEIPALDIYDRQAGITYLARIRSAHGYITDAERDCNRDMLTDADRDNAKQTQATRKDAMRNGNKETGVKYISAANAEKEIREVLRTYGRFKPTELQQYVADVGHAVVMSGLANAEKVDELITWALSEPHEREVEEWVAAKHSYLNLSERGIYEYTDNVWQRRSDAVIESHIIKELGRFKAAGLVKRTMTLLLAEAARDDIRMNRKPVMNFINGALDLETFQFRKHSPTDYSTHIVDYPYDANAKCPQWEQFMFEVCAGVEERVSYIQEFFGYVLCPDCRFSKCLILKGEGSNGKTIALDMLTAVFGGAGNEQISGLNLSDFGDPFSLVHLDGARINIATELDATGLKKAALEKFKNVVSGDAILQACRKGKDYYTFTPTAKLLFAGNNYFSANDSSRGLVRRLSFIEFPVEFSPNGEPLPPMAEMKRLIAENPETRATLFAGKKRADGDLRAKLMTERSGIFNWIVAGNKRLMLRGKFEDIEDTLRMTAEFAEHTQPVLAFVEDDIKGISGEYTHGELYRRYAAWCEANSYRPFSNRKFFPELERALRAANVVYSRTKDRDGTRYFVF